MLWILRSAIQHHSFVSFMMLSLLLCDGAARAKKIVAEYKPLFASKEEYFAFVDALSANGDRIVYNEDGTALVR